MEKDQGTEVEIERDGTLPAETGVPVEEQQAKQPRGSVFEGIYDQLPDISVRSVDRFIVICVIALAAVILIGVLKANHIF